MNTFEIIGRLYTENQILRQQLVAAQAQLKAEADAKLQALREAAQGDPA